MEIFSLPIDRSNLRDCQKRAYAAALHHYSLASGERNTLLQLPTGTGKTAVIAALPFGLAKKKVLVLTPNVKLARDVANELDIITNPKTNIYSRCKMLAPSVLESLELFILRLETSAAAGDIDENHIIVSNYQQLQEVAKWFQGKEDHIDLILIDEAHHQKAATYQQVIEFFPGAKVIGLTATPFRSDGQAVDGRVIYKYSFNQAITDKVIRNIKVVNVAPREIQLKFTDQDSKTYSLEEILEFKEQTWFNKGIALSQDCCDSIARKAKDKLHELRRLFPDEKHQIIAAAISKRHARENVKSAFEKLNLSVGIVSSDEQDKKTNDETFDKLRRGKIDVIIHIGMLGEGFDHPPLGVAAIFRPFKSLNPYIQFIGRVIRSNGTASHCYVVSHLGLNQLKRFREFQLFDSEDQAFLQTLLPENAELTEETSFVESDEKGLAQDLVVIKELGSHSVEVQTEFVKSEEEKAQQLFDQIEALNPEAKALLFSRLGVEEGSCNVGVTRRDLRIKPGDKRKASQRLLNEKAKTITTNILHRLKLNHKGRNFTKMYANFEWVIRRVNRILNKQLGITNEERKNITNTQYASFEERGILKQVEQEALDYFTSRAKKKPKV